MRENQTDLDVTRGCPGYEQALEGNWNGNVSFGDATAILVPDSLDEVCAIVRDATACPIRVIGRGHSFSPLVKSTGGTILCLQKCNRILDYRPPAPTNNITTNNNTVSMGSITVEGGTTYTEVIQFLRAQDTPGALVNLPSCPQFTIGGAIATAVHGSGIHIHNLSAHVSMLEFITADGSLVCYDRDSSGDDDKSTKDILEGCRVHLGCLGVISRLRLDVVPYYTVDAVRYDDIPLERMIANLPHWWTRCDSLSVWTSGFGQGVGKGTCWATFRQFVRQTDSDDAGDEQQQKPLPSFLTFEELGDTGHVCEKAIPRYCTDPKQPELFHPTGRGPWYDCLTLTMDQGQETCMSTKDIQAEFFVPLEHAQAALRAVWVAVAEWKFSPPWGYQHPEDSASPPPKRGMVDAMEFRQVRGRDGAWLSPHDAGDCLGIHISFNGDPSLRRSIQEYYLPTIEQALDPFGAKPHWGKLATPETYSYSHIRERYPPSSIENFQRLCHDHDPDGKFLNDFVKQVLFGSE